MQNKETKKIQNRSYRQRTMQNRSSNLEATKSRGHTENHARITY